MLIAALTGGIATGKSIAAKTFQQLGCYIHEADKVAHALMQPDEPAWKSIIRHFGKDILNPDKTIDRVKLGRIIFNHPKERQVLNQILHPLVFEKKKEIIRTLRKKQSHKIFISEAALTIEAGFHDFFDRVVITYCKPDIQISRLMERDRLTRAEAEKKICSQMPQDKKQKFADYTIDTSGTLKETIEQTERVFRSLMLDYEMIYGGRQH